MVAVLHQLRSTRGLGQEQSTARPQSSTPIRILPVRPHCVVDLGSEAVVVFRGIAADCKNLPTPLNSGPGANGRFRLVGTGARATHRFAHRVARLKFRPQNISQTLPLFSHGQALLTHILY